MESVKTQTVTDPGGSPQENSHEQDSVVTLN